MSYELNLTDVDDPEVEKAIAAPLIEYNNSKAGPGNGRPLVITVRDTSGAVIGGLSGYTSRKWLFTHLLVVPEALRSQGIGSKIMKIAEEEAIARNCLGAWLDTFEFQSRGFYEKMGYVCFGEIQDYPPGFSRFFMKKHFPGTVSGA
jgi:GNAT superfamily N-acetyltransferase